MTGKQNDILAARTALELFDIKGMLVTADTLPCNANIAQLILGRGADYLIALEGNRPSILAEVQRLFASPPNAIPEHVTIDNDHGRLETRRHQVWHDVGC